MSKAPTYFHMSWNFRGKHHVWELSEVRALRVANVAFLVLGTYVAIRILS